MLKAAGYVSIAIGIVVTLREAAASSKHLWKHPCGIKEGMAVGFQRLFNMLHRYIGLQSTNRSKVVDPLSSNTQVTGFTMQRNGLGSTNSSDKGSMSSIQAFSSSNPSAMPNYTWNSNESKRVSDRKLLGSAFENESGKLRFK